MVTINNVADFQRHSIEWVRSVRKQVGFDCASIDRYLGRGQDYWVFHERIEQWIYGAIIEKSASVTDISWYRNKVI